MLTLVLQELAKKYYDAGNTLVYIQGHSSDQLGPGAYISPIRADWPMADVNWDCAVLADSTAWNLVNKAWVPSVADDGCTPLWWAKGSEFRPESSFSTVLVSGPI